MVLSAFQLTKVHDISVCVCVSQPGYQRPGKSLSSSPFKLD